MPILFDDPAVEPDDLVEFVRELPTPVALQFLNDFPRLDSEDNTVDWGEIARTNRVARYRAFDGRVHVSERDAGSYSRVELPPLSTSLSQGELEALRLEFARNGGTRFDRLAAAAYNDAEQLTREVQNRLELAWGDLLSDGILTMPELGGLQTDYGLDEMGHLVTPAVAWTAANLATMTPLADITSWNDAWIAANGSSAGRLRTSQATRRLMLQSREVIDAVYGSTQGRSRVNLNELNELLEGEGLPTLDPVYDTSLIGVDDTETRVMDPARVLLLPTDLGELGSTAYGVSATALELVDSNHAELSFEEAAGIVGVIVKDGPPFRQQVFVDAVAMPVLTNARRLISAKVR